MPAIFDRTLNRRSFLTIAGASAFLVGCRVLPQASAAQEFRVALLSDTHIPADEGEAYRGFQPVANLKKITSEVVGWKPEIVIINGDAARLDGKLADYEALSGLLRPIADVAPVCVSLGNHDDRANFGAVFKSNAGARQNVAGKNVMIIEHDVVRIIVLDSLMYVNKTAGQLGKAQRGWLAANLPKLADRPAALMVHHTLQDGDGDLTDSAQLFEILRKNRHVKALFYGHSHVWALGEREGVKMINLPAVAYPFQEKDPIGWMEGRFTRGGVELTLRASGSNTAENGKKFQVNWS